MSKSQLDTLVHMINQIAANNTAYETADAAQRIANHIKRFWARSMKKQIIAYHHSDGEALSPIAKLALEQLEIPT